jgi:hypothetical protein
MEKILKWGALNNATGRWNEFIATSLLSEIVLEINKDNDACSAVFSLPNSQSQKEGAEEAYSKFISLFKSSEFAPGQPLAKLAPFKDYIFMPSPDYIIVVLGKSDVATSINPLLEQQVKNPDSLALYNFLKENYNYINFLKSCYRYSCQNKFPSRQRSNDFFSQIF